MPTPRSDAWGMRKRAPSGGKPGGAVCCDSSPVVDDDVFIGAGAGAADGCFSSDDLVARVVVNALEDELAEGFLLAAEDEKPVGYKPDESAGRAVGREVYECFPRVCEAENPVALGYGGVGDGIIEERVAGGGADSQGAGLTPAGSRARTPVCAPVAARRPWCGCPARNPRRPWWPRGRPGCPGARRGCGWPPRRRWWHRGGT